MANYKSVSKIFATYINVCVKGDQNVKKSLETCMKRYMNWFLNNFVLSLSSKKIAARIIRGYWIRNLLFLSRRQASRSIFCFPKITYSIPPSCIWKQQMFVIYNPFLPKRNFFWSIYWHYSILINVEFCIYLVLTKYAETLNGRWFPLIFESW